MRNMAAKGRKLRASPNYQRHSNVVELIKCRFPITSVDSTVELFHEQICQSNSPDLALLSIVLGSLESRLTCDPPQDCDVVSTSFPALQFEDVRSLYDRFSTLLHDAVSLDDVASCQRTGRSSRHVVRRVSDIVWSQLNSSYPKDRAHMQSIFSLLTENRLDCFGVATCVVAACQVLGLDDVHLAMTEDHVWVVFGENGQETTEVTWHGKGIEDRRGEPVMAGVLRRSWLYLNGKAVICTRHMELAAMISSINPSINTASHSAQLSAIQLQLLWLLYDAGHLERYPVIINQLGDLCELNSSPDRPTPLVLYGKAIESARTHYANMHVYPYTYLGHYFYRNRNFKHALEAWADASDVISKYNYGRDDEEVYKEFFEIANLIIPQILRIEQENSRARPEHWSMVNDSVAFSFLLRFYDGLCLWEEDSSTPVLHITWATHMLSSVSKFSAETRSQVNILDSLSAAESVALSDEEKREMRLSSVGEKRSAVLKSSSRGIHRAPLSVEINSSLKSSSREIHRAPLSVEIDSSCCEGSDGMESSSCKSGNSSTVCKLNDFDISPTFDLCIDDTDVRDKEIAYLAHGCRDKLLNPDFLRGSGDEPFLEDSSHQLISLVSKTQMDLSEFTSVCYEELPMLLKVEAEEPSHTSVLEASVEPQASNGQCEVLLRSAKMRALKNLLVASKLNSNAITLQLTAQSQVHLKHRGLATDRNNRKRLKLN